MNTLLRSNRHPGFHRTDRFYMISVFNKLVMHSVETLQRIARFGKSGVSVLKVKKSSL